MKTLAKIIFMVAVFVLSAKTALAQVTLDLSVFGEAPASQKEEPSIQLDLSEILGEENESSKKQEVRKPTVKKPVVKKPVVSKTKKAQKPKAPEIPMKVAPAKVISKIKPRSKPVQKVKVLEEVVSEAPKPVVKKKTSKPAPKKKAVKVAPKKVSAPKKKQAPKKVVEPKVKPLLKEKKAAPSLLEKEKTVELVQPVEEKVEQKAQQTQQKRGPAFIFDKPLSAKERTALLEKEIPADSATKKALENGLDFVQILHFEEGEIVLNPEMKTALEQIAQDFKTKGQRNLYIFAYSGQSPAFYGKERQFSLRRALRVRSYLTQLGIPSLKIELRSQGLRGAGSEIPNRVDILSEGK